VTRDEPSGRSAGQSPGRTSAGPPVRQAGPGGPSLRLFVACELPGEAREALAAVQRLLQEQGAEGLRWVRPEGIHLTLKFLGDVPARRLEAIERALARAVREPFRLSVRLSQLGSFGGSTGLRVVWLGLEGEVEALARLAAQVEGALEPMGFPRERRPFAAHLTLARVKESASPQDRRRLFELVRSLELPPLPGATLQAVSLMQSTLEPGGARYQRLARFPTASPTEA
jgi:2'-5' RNA ligase